MAYAHQETYALLFNDDEWDEIACMGFEPFEIEPEEELTRGQWFAVAQMALGKAQMLDDGRYGGDEDDGVDPAEWADQLRGIASTILDFFQPADGKI
jgi:hypothetical protein